MAIGSFFEQALMKAVRSIELGLMLNLPNKGKSNSFYTCDERIFVIYEAFKEVYFTEHIQHHQIDSGSRQINNLVHMEQHLMMAI